MANSTAQANTMVMSPFAMMFPEAVREILERAETLPLPRKRFSPLSKPAPWGFGRDEAIEVSAGTDVSGAGSDVERELIEYQELLHAAAQNPSNEAHPA
ncbi:hypothetical protein [Derxia gummosa]|uniref:Uncharacterized protein n=1 Tax=Derxia gummosa DSM 723 TaxID=1121388 RepID=A0A8B6X3D3_9BURK|nr:hypothetical protein [Derxia gummosa]